MVKPIITGRDYGHKSYMKSDDYTSSMVRPSDRNIDNQFKRPHSDDKKPYYDDEYPEMEHFWTPYDPPNFTPPGIPDDPRIVLPPDYPGGGGDDEDHPHGEFTGCVFTVPAGKMLIGPGETTFHGIGILREDPLAGVYVNFGPAVLTADAKAINQCLNPDIVGGLAKCLVTAQAHESFDPDDYIQMGEHFPVQVVATTLSGRQCFWEFAVKSCPPLVEFAWDEENSAETIGQADSVLVFVEGGTTPFEWQVAGEGYTLAQETTNGRSNTLYAAEDACGTATITVTDYCEDEVDGEVLNTAGHWEAYPDECGLTSGSGSGWNHYFTTPYLRLYTTVQAGGKKQTHWQYFEYSGDRYFDDENDCEGSRFTGCGAGTESPCVSYPSHLETGGINAGIFDFCGVGGRYMEECHKEYYWVSRMLTAVDIDILTYYEWICD